MAKDNMNILFCPDTCQDYKNKAIHLNYLCYLMSTAKYEACVAG